MSFAWFWFYGHLLNIPRAELRVMAFGELLDMISCYQIMHGIVEVAVSDDEEIIPSGLK